MVPRNKTTIFIKGKLRTYEMKKIDVDKMVSGSSYSNLRNVWRMKTRTISVVTVILKEISEWNKITTDSTSTSIVPVGSSTLGITVQESSNGNSSCTEDILENWTKLLRIQLTFPLSSVCPTNSIQLRFVPRNWMTR